MTTFAVVTGGGTAGHVLPALAVADALVANGHDPSTIRYVGAQRGIETRLLPETPYAASFLDVVGFQRRVSRRNLGFLPKMVAATREALALLRVWRPAVVVSVGGYASMPAIFAARRLGVPVVVVSFDRTPGRASRLAARRAAACAVAFEGSSLPRAEFTGAPVRQAILDVERDAVERSAAREQLGVPQDRFLVAVIGGSQGSGVLNQAIVEYARAHDDDAGLAIRQVAGERFADELTDSARDGTAGILHQVVGYEANMALLYAACDLLVGRGGASTVHEVAVTGTPAVLVPWAAATDDHQTDNVRWLSEVGAAVLLAEADVRRLGATIERLRDDGDARAALGRAAADRGAVSRSGALARLIERVAVASNAP
jgi:UDP-N-acetylglucosamine:LPS N-acetylglucosamine transferase